MPYDTAWLKRLVENEKKRKGKEPAASRINVLLDEDTDMKLRQMSKDDTCNLSAEIRVLIREEWRRRHVPSVHP